MPVISRFFGSVTYYNGHPLPHFHVRYGSQKALVIIQQKTIVFVCTLRTEPKARWTLQH